MTHSHDRTLLAKLGFSDPDRRNALHDIACRYLIEDAQVLKLLDVAFGLHACKVDPYERVTNSRAYLRACDVGGHWFNQEVTVVESVTERDARTVVEERATERAVSKGSGQYKSTIGFLDGWVVARRVHDELARRSLRAWVSSRGRVSAYPGDDLAPLNGPYNGPDESVLYRSVIDAYCAVGIEVKIGQVPAAEILRQINLYREFVTAGAWVVAIHFDMRAHEKATLTDAGIHVVRLGAKFNEHCVALARSADAVADVEEL